MSYKQDDMAVLLNKIFNLKGSGGGDKSAHFGLFD